MNPIKKDIKLSPEAQAIFDRAAKHSFKNRTVHYRFSGKAEDYCVGNNPITGNVSNNVPGLTWEQHINQIFQELQQAGAITDYIMQKNEDGAIDVQYYC